MPEQFRREIPRQPTDWFGFYRFTNVGHEPSRPCRIIDISTLGAGLELFDISADEQIDGLLSVDIELSGEVQNVVLAEKTKTARVGVNFPNPTQAALEYVEELHKVRGLW